MILDKLGISLTIGATLGGGFFKTMRKAEATTASLGDAWKKTNAQLKSTESVIHYKTRLEKLQARQTKLGGSSARLGKLIDKTDRKYQEASRSAKKYGINVKKITEEKKRLSKALGRVERDQIRLDRRDRAASRLRGMRGATVGAIGSAYGLGRMLSGSMDLEEQGVYLRTVINARDGDKDAAVERAKANARETARTTLATEKEMLEIEYMLNSAGLEEEAARAGASIVHMVAKNTRGVSSEVGDIIGSVYNNLGKSIDGNTEDVLMQIGNILTKTQYQYAIKDFNQLGEGMKYATASAMSMNISLAQTAAMIGQLNTGALKGSQAGTAFEAMMRRMTKATSELGINMVRDENGELDVLATLEKIDAATKDLDRDARSDLLRNLFGDEGLRAAISLLSNLEATKKAYKEVERAGASSLLQNDYNRLMESSAGQWKMLGENMSIIGNVMATSVLPFLNALVRWVSKGVVGFGKFLETFPMLGTVIATAVAALAGFVTAVSVATLIMWGWNAAIIANPIGLLVGIIIVATVIIGAALYKLYENWEYIWKSITDAVGSAWEYIGGIFESITAGIKSITSGIGSLFGFGGKEVSVGASVRSIPPKLENMEGLPMRAGNTTQNIKTGTTNVHINVNGDADPQGIYDTFLREDEKRRRSMMSDLVEVMG